MKLRILDGITSVNLGGGGGDSGAWMILPLILIWFLISDPI